MTTEISIQNEVASFELVQRQAKMLSSSTLVPKEFQNNPANCAIGLNIAKRLGADPFMVVQNIDVIHGRPSFRATFLIAMVNASGRFSPLQFRMTGEGATRGCTAHAKTRDGEIVEGPEITMSMAVAEGWATKPGSKWKTMPELMLRYRAAAFFARIYAPDITLGMHTAEEAADMPEPPRVTVGRVIEPTTAVIAANPYEDAMPSPQPEHEPEPEPQPQPTDEPVLESPVEISEETERKELTKLILGCIAENDSTKQKFGLACKAFGLVKPTGTLVDTPIKTLRVIAENRLAILSGTFNQEVTPA